MGTVLMTVLILDPFEHTSTPVIIEVGIDIREGDTVRVEETLEQKVVLQRVDLSDTQAVGHHRTCGRTTARTHHHTQFITG